MGLGNSAETAERDVEPLNDGAWIAQSEMEMLVVIFGG